MRALGLAIPASDAGESVRDVGDLHIERRGVEQIEPPPRQHALPGASGKTAGCRLARHGGAWTYFILPEFCNTGGSEISPDGPTGMAPIRSSNQRQTIP